jgi:hypothetical protein
MEPKKLLKPWAELEMNEKWPLIRFYGDEPYEDELAVIRNKAHHTNGFRVTALKDEDEETRIEGYRRFGFTIEAFKDESPEIRLEAYQVLGFTKEALEDEEERIRDIAKIFFDYVGQPK